MLFSLTFRCQSRFGVWMKCRTLKLCKSISLRFVSSNTDAYLFKTPTLTCTHTHTLSLSLALSLSLSLSFFSCSSVCANCNFPCYFRLKNTHICSTVEITLNNGLCGLAPWASLMLWFCLFWFFCFCVLPFC